VIRIFGKEVGQVRVGSKGGPVEDDRDDPLDVHLRSLRADGTGDCPGGRHLEDGLQVEALRQKSLKHGSKEFLRKCYEKKTSYNADEVETDHNLN